MTFGFSVQMEALNGGGGADGIDESYVTISSDMLGQIILGSENSAGYLSMVAAPQVGSMPINSRSISAFVPITAVGRLPSGGPVVLHRGRGQQRRAAHHLLHAVLQRPDRRCVLRAEQRRQRVQQRAR